MKDMEPVLSLIMATRGRTEPIAVFLDALRKQAVSGVELLVVDQNADDRVDRLLASHTDDLPIRHLRARPGLSAARNLGTAVARGAILGFPDDDCWYPANLLVKVLAWFAENPQSDGLSCRVCDADGGASAGGYMARKPHWITRSNVWRSVTSPGLFVRRRVHAAVGGFDELVGLAAASPWGSAEESDYVLQALKRGSKIFYDPTLTVIHPRRNQPLRRDVIARAWSYGSGMGYVLCKNHYGAGQAAYYACMPALSAAAALVRARPGRAAARVAMGAARMIGWCRAARHLAERDAAVAAIEAEDILHPEAAGAGSK